MHGGLIATLTDTMGSLAIASKGFYSTGVSTDINTTFVKAAGGVGDEVVAEGSVISLGELSDKRSGSDWKRRRDTERETFRPSLAVSCLTRF